MDLSSWMLKGSISDIRSQLKRIPFLQNTLTISQTLSGPSILMVYYATLDASMFQTSGNLQLCVLKYSHDHPLAGHFSQTKTLSPSPHAILLVRTSSLCQEITENHAPLVPMPNLCATKPYRLLSNFRFLRSLEFCEATLRRSYF